MHSIHTYVGTSAGAIIALLCVIGYSYDDMTLLLSEFIGTELTSIGFERFFNLPTSLGLDDGTKLIELCEIALKKKGFDPDITMIDLSKKTGKNLVICVTNLSLSIAEYISVDTLPEISVKMAIRMSTSIPFIFVPVMYNGHYYVDGAVTNGFPIEKCDSNLGETICLIADVKSPNINPGETPSLSNFAYNVYNTYTSYHKRHSTALLSKSSAKYTIVTIELNDEPMNNDTDMSDDYSGINIVFDKKIIDKYLDEGYKHCMQHF